MIEGNEIDEVLVVPEKHLRVWMTGDSRFRQVMGLHHIEEAGHLEFLDQYPRVAVALPTSAVAFRRPDDLIGHLKEEGGGHCAAWRWAQHGLSMTLGGTGAMA
ncbi:MAG: hypothetical protein WDM92_09520 [Caulobacteraceae bacterium]